MNQEVGKIKRLIFNEDQDSLDIVIEISDKKFQKKLLRDLMFSGNLSIEGDKLIYISNEEDDAALSISMPKV